MSVPAHISRVALETVLQLLIPLLLAAAGTEAAARQGALDMLSEYNPETAEELGLAAEIIAFRLTGLRALRNIPAPGTQAAQAVGLMKAATALRRSETAAQRKLDALRRARRAPAKQAEARQQPDAEMATRATPPAPAAAPATAQPPAPDEQAAAPASPFDAFVQCLTEEFVADGHDPEETREAATEMAKAFSRGLYGVVLNGTTVADAAQPTG